MQRRDDPQPLRQLFEAVYEAPEADGSRHVLSDALLERGDERGEFIALQLLEASGAATPKQAARAKTLEENHWRRWLVELPGIARTRHSPPRPYDFHRGFLRSCLLTPTGIGEDSPTWRLLERLHVTGAGDARELSSPALQHLHTLTGLDAGSLAVVLAGPDKPNLRELGFIGPWLQQDDRARAERRQVLALSRFPGVRVLSLTPRPTRHHADWLGWLFDAPQLRQLERLELHLELPFDVAGLHAQLLRAGLTRLKLTLRTDGVSLDLTPDWLTVRFANEAALTLREQALKNLAPRFVPFPYRRFEVKVGERKATVGELEQLGERFTAHAQ